MECGNSARPANALVAFYTNRTARTAIFVGPIFSGIMTRESVFKAPSTPGTYYFHCDVHPQMQGDFIVQ